MAILSKEYREIIEERLFMYSDEKDNLDARKEDAIWGVSCPDNNGGGRSNRTTDKTFSSVLKIIEVEDDINAKWVKVINDTIDYYSLQTEKPEYLKIIKYTYLKPRRVSDVIKKLYLSKMSYYKLRDTILVHIALEAARKGLL